MPLSGLQRLSAQATVALLLTSCSSYAPTPGEATAKIRLISYVDTPTTFWVYDAAACPSSKKLVEAQMASVLPFDKTTIGMIGKSDRPPERTAERLVPANRALFLWLESGVGAIPGRPGYSCSVAFRFEPAPNGQYEMQFKLNSDQCSVRLLRLELDANGEVRRQPERSTVPVEGANGKELCSNSPRS